MSSDVQKLIMRPAKLLNSIMLQLHRRIRNILHKLQSHWFWIFSVSFNLLLIISTCWALFTPLAEPRLEFDEGPVASFEIPCGGESPNLQEYLEPLKSRDLFAQSDFVPTSSKLTSSTAQQLLQRLKFVGIIGTGPQTQALVAIAQQSPAAFKINDQVAEFILKDIKKDSLVLELDHEQFALKR